MPPTRASATSATWWYGTERVKVGIGQGKVRIGDALSGFGQSRSSRVLPRDDRTGNQGTALGLCTREMHVNDWNSPTTKLLTLLNVSAATHSSGKESTYEKHFGPVPPCLNQSVIDSVNNCLGSTSASPFPKLGPVVISKVTGSPGPEKIKAGSSHVRRIYRWCPHNKHALSYRFSSDCGPLLRSDKPGCLQV